MKILMLHNRYLIPGGEDPSSLAEVAILREHGVTPAEAMTPFARFALACPALPTCGLALTEAERVHAPLVACRSLIQINYGNIRGLAVSA